MKFNICQMICSNRNHFQLYHMTKFCNSLILNQTKFWTGPNSKHQYADDKLIVTEKSDICSGKGRKYCEKRRKCWLPAFSLFSTMFSKGFFQRVIKNQDCVVNS